MLSKDGDYTFEVIVDGKKVEEVIVTFIPGDPYRKYITLTRTPYHPKKNELFSFKIVLKDQYQNFIGGKGVVISEYVNNKMNKDLYCVFSEESKGTYNCKMIWLYDNDSTRTFGYNVLSTPEDADWFVHKYILKDI